MVKALLILPMYNTIHTFNKKVVMFTYVTTISLRLPRSGPFCIALCKMVCRTFKFFFELHLFVSAPPTKQNPCHQIESLCAPAHMVSFRIWKYDKRILDVTEISVRQLRKMRRNWEEFWEVIRPHLASGRPKKLNRTHHHALLQYLEQRPTAFQDEMAWFLWDEFQLVVAESTISRALNS